MDSLQTPSSASARLRRANRKYGKRRPPVTGLWELAPQSMGEARISSMPCALAKRYPSANTGRTLASNSSVPICTQAFAVLLATISTTGTISPANGRNRILITVAETEPRTPRTSITTPGPIVCSSATTSSIGAVVAPEFPCPLVTTSARVARATSADSPPTLSVDALRGCVVATRRATAATLWIGTGGTGRQPVLTFYRRATCVSTRQMTEERRRHRYRWHSFSITQPPWRGYS